MLRRQVEEVQSHLTKWQRLDSVPEWGQARQHLSRTLGELQEGLNTPAETAEAQPQPAGDPRDQSKPEDAEEFTVPPTRRHWDMDADLGY